MELVCVGPTEARKAQNPLKTGTFALLARYDSRKRPCVSRDKSAALFAGSLCWFGRTLRWFASLCLSLCSFMLVCVQFGLVCVGLGWLCDRLESLCARKWTILTSARVKRPVRRDSKPHTAFCRLRQVRCTVCREFMLVSAHFALVCVTWSQSMFVYVGLCWLGMHQPKPVPRSKRRTS